MTLRGTMTVGSKPFYVDPSTEEWLGPNLITGLMRNPHTEFAHPLERQVTVVLAWLLHHSPSIARNLTRKFLVDDHDALEQLERTSVLGARAWGTLRPLLQPKTGHLYPDLSIAGSERSLELLVEVKVDAEIHWWTTEDGLLYQPDAYIRSWRENYDSDAEARVRRVGTLTKTGPGVALDHDEMRARDVTWKETRALLAELLANGEIEREVVAVAVDFVSALDEFVLKPAKTPQTNDPSLAWGYGLFQKLVPQLAARLVNGEMRTKPGLHEDFVSAYVYFNADGATQRLWVAVTSEGGRYNVSGAKARLWLSEVTESKFPPALAERFRMVGFTRTDNIARYPKTLRLGVDVAEVQAAGAEEAQLAFALDWMLRALEPIGAVTGAASTPLVDAASETGG
jgi:hypothetical protein